MSKNPVLTEAQEAALAAQRQEAAIPRPPIGLDGLPAAPVARPVRGRRRPPAITLPPDLIDALDALAAKEEQSRAKMVEILLRHGLAEWGVARPADQEAHEAMNRLAQLGEIPQQPPPDKVSQ